MITQAIAVRVDRRTCSHEEKRATVRRIGQTLEGTRPALVRWLGRAEERVRSDLKPLFSKELETLFKDDRAVEITVHDCFAGYNADQEKKVVLGVEVRSVERYESHIVKLGTDVAVNADHEGWTRCAGNRYIGGRIFVRLRAHDVGKGRTGVIYEDAYTLFGLDQKTQAPEFLECSTQRNRRPISIPTTMCAGCSNGRSYHRHQWHDELDFALAVYGLSTAKWPNYDRQQTECALIAAGVAVARLKLSQRHIPAQLPSASPPTPSGPCYRPALWHTHRELNARNFAAARQFVEGAMADFLHSVPLKTEYALILAEQLEYDQAVRVVEPLQRLCWVFGDYEPLTRIGRAFKNQGDRTWEDLGPPFTLPARGTPPWQYYHTAFLLYRNAYQISGGHHLPGVNAATLALLIGARDEAKECADRVLARCRSEQLPARGEELYWIFASEGEAALVSDRPGRDILAQSYYNSALNTVGASDIRNAQSSWDQLCRLWCTLGSDLVGPVVDAFREHTSIWKELTRGPLDDCGRHGSR